MSHGNWYERNVLPWLIDFACGMKSVSQQRMKVIPQAQGRVLEIGLGTGLNLPFYDTGRVSELVGVEPSLTMHHLAMKRSRAAGIPVETRRHRRRAPAAGGCTSSTRWSAPTRCAPSPIRCWRCANCAACWRPAAGCCSPSTAARRTRTCASGRRASSRCGANSRRRLPPRPRHPGHPQGSRLRRRRCSRCTSPGRGSCPTTTGAMATAV
jgi:hypothetical protein